MPDHTELVKNLGKRGRMLIRCTSMVAGREFDFSLEALIDDVANPLFLEGYLEPTIGQLLNELEFRLLGTTHEYGLTRGELVS